MKNKYKLREGVDSQTFVSTKWDQTDWTTEMKTFWQETMFSLGFGWDFDKLQEVSYIENSCFWCEPLKSLSYLYTKEDIFTSDCTATEKYWDDMFELITHSVSSQEALSEGLPKKRYKYTKKEFEHSWEALQHFTEQGGLYYLHYGEQLEITSEQDTLISQKVGNIYIKEELPWWETVSKDKPCYVWFDKSLHKVNRLKEGKMTVKEFLEKGYKFVEGDVILNHAGTEDELNALQSSNFNSGFFSHFCNKDRYIVSAKALEQTKTKVEYVLTDFNSVGEAVQQVYDNKGMYCSTYQDGTYYEVEVSDACHCWEENILYKKVETKLEWYDNIHESGVLCWASDCGLGERDLITVIKSYNTGNTGYNYYDYRDDGWVYATPLTKEEIQEYLNVAPE